MSIEAIGWALYVPVGGNQKVVLIGLANHADPAGLRAYPSYATLAQYACCDRSTAKRNVMRLEDDEWISRMGVGRAGTIVWRLHLDRGMQNAPGHSAPRGTGDPQGGAPAPPEPSLNRPLERERASGPVKFRGRPVVQESWDLSARILEEFNRQASTKLRLLTSAGEPSDAATRIYGRVRKYPDIDFDEHADIVRRTLASRWWGTGPPAIGVVYGPKVFEDNITRQAPAAAGGDARQAQGSSGTYSGDLSRFARKDAA